MAAGFTSCLLRLRALARRVLGYPFVRNVNAAKRGAGGRRCLMVNLSTPFVRPPDHPSFLAHQNMGQARMMATALGEAGYEVDVADVRSFRIPAPAAPYDLILTHHPALEMIRRQFSDETTVVYLATGMAHAEHNRRVEARRADLERRRGCRIPPFAVNAESVSVLSRADALAGLGNAATTGTWSTCFGGPAFFFDNSGFEWIRPARQAAPDRARHFLFFGGVDQVRKGLDLLLDVFPALPDLHLHVAGHYALEREFCACYREELYRTSNVHLHGDIRVGSPDWESLIGQCAFAILPTCSEGQAGSVTQTMHAGLVPVVTPAAGLDVKPFGVELPGEPLPVLAETLARLAAFPPAGMDRLREATLAAARTRFSEAAFLARWREIAGQMAELDRRRRPGAGALHDKVASA
jgi:glycosyltransferase involved in cell wall biosynthesis